RACEELNLNVGDLFGVRLEVIGWETHVPPGMGHPQQVILRHIDISSMDLFVGIMASRFGTPTDNAGSGTEEEYLRAKTSHLRRGTPEIWFYFRSARPRQRAPQQHLVDEFRAT